MKIQIREDGENRYKFIKTNIVQKDMKEKLI